MKRSLLALSLILGLASCSNLPRMAGKVPPDFYLSDQSGKIWETQKLRQETYVLDFWATWCAPCVASIPDLNRYQELHGAKVKLLGIAIEEKGWAVVKPFIAEHDIRYPVATGLGSLAAAYGIDSFPTLLIIHDGKVVSQLQGRHSLAEIEAALAPYLN